MSETEHTRRSVVRKTVTVGATAVTLPAMMNVVSADTTSGSVELETAATVPTNTSIDITIFEDTDGSGSSNRQQTKSIPDGTATTEYDLLQSSTAQGDVLWLEVSLSTSDTSVTPSVDSATVTLPAESSTATTTSEPASEPDDPQTLGQIWQNPRAFVAAAIIAVAGIGLWSRSLTLAAWGAYVAFLHIAFTADGFPMFRNIAIATLVLTFLGFAFKLIRLEFEGES